MARKNYSDEFRRQAVELYESTPGATVRGIAEDLGIERGTLRGCRAAQTPPARRTAPPGHRRPQPPLLSPADKVVVTVAYLRQVCPQKVLAELLSTNPVTIGQAIKETRSLIDQQRITISQTPHYFSHTQDLREWFDEGAATTQMQTSHALTHPDLTGMTREDFHALLDRVSVAYRAAIERRRHHQRGGARRQEPAVASSGRTVKFPV